MSPPDPLAVVGIGCRFPGGDGPDAFFRLLENGESAVTEVPQGRFDARAIYDPDRDAPGKSVSRWGGFLDDVAGFDWQAFSVSPREARQMDPQQRLLLEVAWEALEDAGLPMEQVAGSRAGVYVGAMWLEYQSLATRRLEQIDPYTLTGNHLLFTANRISHCFDLRGPSVAMDVGCAASLVAFHYACQDLWRGEADLALAGGVNLMLTPEAYVARSKAGVLSPSGRCATFDASADGFVPGEGAGVVVLKPLRRALEDGDRIHGLVRGTAVNHNGRTPWIQAVSASAQESLIRSALDRAGVTPDEVDYVELHGTGTSTGDPVEARALSAVFGRQPPAPPLAVGSVKTNVGHLESAGSIAHVIKVLLSLQRATLLPSINLATVNPEISLEVLGLEVPRVARPWPSRGRPRIAGVTSLALGGANAHAVLQEAPAAPPAEAVAPGPGPFILPLSARTGPSLQRLAAAHAERLRGADGARLFRYCRAAARRRSQHAWRAAAVAPDAAKMVEKLEAMARVPAPAAAAGKPKVLFVFTGQGAARARMGLPLAESEPVVREALGALDGKLRAITGWSLLEVLSDPPEKTRLERSEYAQPAQVAVQLALLALWRSWGVEPDMAVGHSLGEISAAVACGALDVDQALRLSWIRGKLMERPEVRGKMAQVRRAAAEVERVLANVGSPVVVAVVNGPRTTVISGAAADVDAAVAALEREGASCRPVATTWAFHSPPMGPLGQELAREAAFLTPRPADRSLLSTLTGGLISGADLDAAYWGRQVREPVAFAAAFEVALAEGAQLVVEVSPHPLLQEGMEEAAEAAGKKVALVSTLRRNADEAATAREALASAWARGAKVAWEAVLPGRAVHQELPRYPWERQPCWLPPAPPERAKGHPLAGEHLPLAGHPGEHVFSSEVSLEDVPLLADHQIQGAAVMPAAAYVEMAVHAARATLGAGAVEVKDLELHRPLVLEKQRRAGLQIALTVQGAGAAAFQIHARSADGTAWSQVAQGTVRVSA